LFVAVTSDGTRVYVSNLNANAVSVIDAATRAVVATIPVGVAPLGVAMSPDDSLVYVANFGSNTVSVLAADRHRHRDDSRGQQPIRCGGLAPWDAGVRGQRVQR
jgi:YVTN family beta-propeller protein